MAAPVLSELTDKAYWFSPTSSASALTPSAGAVDRGDDRGERPVADRDVLSGHGAEAQTAGGEVGLDSAPRPRVERDSVEPVAAMSVTVLAWPSTVMMPSVPLTALPAESPRAAFAEPEPTCRVACDPCSAVESTSWPELFVGR